MPLQLIEFKSLDVFEDEFLFFAIITGRIELLELHSSVARPIVTSASGPSARLIPAEIRFGILPSVRH